MVKIKPLGERVLIERLGQEKTKGGIIISGTAQETGFVVAVGSGKLLKKGDKVFFSKKNDAMVEEIKIEGKEYIVAAEKDVLAVIE